MIYENPQTNNIPSDFIFRVPVSTQYFPLPSPVNILLYIRRNQTHDYTYKCTYISMYIYLYMILYSRMHDMKSRSLASIFTQDFSGLIADHCVDIKLDVVTNHSVTAVVVYATVSLCLILRIPVRY